MICPNLYLLLHAVLMQNLSYPQCLHGLKSDSFQFLFVVRMSNFCERLLSCS